MHSHIPTFQSSFAHINRYRLKHVDGNQHVAKCGQNHSNARALSRSMLDCQFTSGRPMRVSTLLPMPPQHLCQYAVGWCQHGLGRTDTGYDRHVIFSVIRFFTLIFLSRWDFVLCGRQCAFLDVCMLASDIHMYSQFCFSFYVHLHRSFTERHSPVVAKRN